MRATSRAGNHAEPLAGRASGGAALFLWAALALAGAAGCGGTRRQPGQAPVSRGGPPPALLARADQEAAAAHWGRSLGALAEALDASPGSAGSSEIRDRVHRVLQQAPLPVAAMGLAGLASPGREDLLLDGAEVLRARACAPGAPPMPGLEEDLARVSPYSGGSAPAGSLPDSVEARVIVPLSGPNRAYGEALLSGMREGLGTSSISIHASDAGGDLLTVSQASSRALDSPFPGLVVGSALSGPTAVLAAAAQASRTPLLSPSAEEDRVAGLGRWIFSSVPTRALQGQQLARYFFESNGARSAVALAVDGPGDDGLARGFCAAARLRGITVPLLRYRDASRIGKIAEQLRDAPPEVIVLDGDQGQVLAIESQLAYYEVSARLAGGEEFRPGRLPRATLERFEGSAYIEPEWSFDSLADGAEDPGPRSARGIEDPELRSAVTKGIAAGKILLWLSGQTFAGPAGIRERLGSLCAKIDADSSVHVVAPPGARLPVYQIEEGKARRVR